MYLRSLVLRQFRSHRDLDLSVAPGVNLFIGPNGAGKTNLIESIAVLATGISPRGADCESMVQWNEGGFFIRGTFAFETLGLDPVTLEMRYKPGEPRQIRQNGQIVVRLKELIGKIPLVSFVPEDLALVKGEPDLRRRAINMVLLQVDPEYAEALRTFNEALRSRNAALRQIANGEAERDALEPWSRAMARAGIVVCRKREEFIADFSSRVARVQERVSGGQDEAALEYKPSFPGPWDGGAEERWLERLRRVQEQEIAVGATLTGPQRDDVVFMLGGRPARSFGSEGQMRTCAVSFKLAEIPYIFEKLGHKPICLLDDVLSELDGARAEHLLDELSKTGQCFVTMTGLEAWTRHRALPAAVFRIDDGTIHPESVESAAKDLVNF